MSMPILHHAMGVPVKGEPDERCLRERPCADCFALIEDQHLRVQAGLQQKVDELMTGWVPPHLWPEQAWDVLLGRHFVSRVELGEQWVLFRRPPPRNDPPDMADRLERLSPSPDEALADDMERIRESERRAHKDAGRIIGSAEHNPGTGHD